MKQKIRDYLCKMETKYKHIAFILFFGVWSLSAQTIGQLEQKLKLATGFEKARIAVELAEKMINSNPKKGSEIAQQAYNTASGLADQMLMARASFVNAQCFQKFGDKSGAKIRFKKAQEHAVAAGNLSFANKSLEQMASIAKSEKDYVEAYNISQQAVAMYQNAKGGTAAPSSGSSTSQREVNDLRSQIQGLKDKISEIAKERDALKATSGTSGSNTAAANLLKAKDQEIAQLKAQLNQIQKTTSQKDEELAKTAENFVKAEQTNKRKQKLLEALSNEKSLDSIANAQELQEITLNLTKVELQNSRNRNIRNLLIALFVGGVIFSYVLYRRFTESRRAKLALEAQNRIIERERERSEELIHNILPADIAAELKEHGQVAAKQYDNASVLFTDFKNFTQIAENLTPDALVAELDFLFRHFDQIINLHHLEKIKTIGDAYMAATGLSERNLLPPVSMIRAAIDIQDFLNDYKKDKIAAGEPYFEARIGIHTGAVVAGVVGRNKFAYDIWGDTVNIAARLEAACEPGRINISETTYQQVKYNCSCTYRGRIAVKNKGELDMYYVDNLL